MKKSLILCAVCLLSSFISAEAFENREHCTVAYIAEQHMTAKAKANFYKAFGNHHLVEYASDPDFYRAAQRYNGLQMGHRVDFDENLRPILYDKSEKLNAYSGLLMAIGQLKHYKDLDDSTLISAAGMLIHYMGDSHCPSHINYADGRQKIEYIIYQKYRSKTSNEGLEVKYHSFWDAWCAERRYNGGYMDLAFQVDICTPAEIKKIQEGTLEDWLHESAATCQNLYDVKTGDVVERMYVIRKAEYVAIQVRNAGYRLAAIMNVLFAN